VKQIGSEHNEQCAFFDWVRSSTGMYPDLELMYAIPNGAKLPYVKSKGRSGKVSRWSPEAAKLKAEGLKSGVPDIHLPVKRGKYIGLWIEMKWGKNVTSATQKQWLDSLAKQGHFCVVCYSAEEAIAMTVKYLSMEQG
jgi:hypothetical protein